MKGIDHIVYCTNAFEETCQYLEKLMGITIAFGGHHESQGTKNAIFHLGGKCYFEILGIDENNKKISPPRWMGIDYLRAPKITRWAISTESLEKDCETLKSYSAKMGEIKKGQRKMKDGNLLEWRMALPLAEPEVEAMPFIIDWSASSHHPTDNLRQECELISMDISHPNPKIILPIFEQLTLNLEIKESEKVEIFARIKTPNGIIKI